VSCGENEIGLSVGLFTIEEDRRVRFTWNSLIGESGHDHFSAPWNGSFEGTGI